MQHKDNKSSLKLQEKRVKLIEVSNQAKTFRAMKVKTAKSIAEADFWLSKTINYILLNHIYNTGNTIRYETFKEWKAQGATIRKGAKATVIWGQPRIGVSVSDTKDSSKPKQEADTEPDEYEFFPLCFLFSENDIYFPNNEHKDEECEAVKPITTNILKVDISSLDAM